MRETNLGTDGTGCHLCSERLRTVQLVRKSSISQEVLYLAKRPSPAVQASQCKDVDLPLKIATLIDYQASPTSELPNGERA